MYLRYSGEDNCTLTGEILEGKKRRITESSGCFGFIEVIHTLP
jgi:hypothetical protein